MCLAVKRTCGPKPETSNQKPDVWQRRHAVYDARAADLFACGVVGYVLATGTYPWQSTAGDCKAALQGLCEDTGFMCKSFKWHACGLPVVCEVPEKLRSFDHGRTFEEFSLAGRPDGMVFSRQATICVIKETYLTRVGPAHRRSALAAH